MGEGAGCLEMNVILAAWNSADPATALQSMLACCGASRWANAMVALRPIAGIQELSEAADRVWSEMGEPDWLEAFATHPRIGERNAATNGPKSTAWSRQEQSSIARADEHVLEELSNGNGEYERRFGITYIVCATGKSPEEMLAILQNRLNNDRNAELQEAAEQQRQIMQIRLGKWLVE